MVADGADGASPATKPWAAWVPIYGDIRPPVTHDELVRSSKVSREQWWRSTRRPDDRLRYFPRWWLRNAGSVICSSVLTDPEGATYPGLTVQLEAKAPIVVDACLYLFTIFKLERGKRIRAYQLEVLPKMKRGHSALAGTIYGPHEHFGDAAFAVVDPQVACGSWDAAYAWFLVRCNLEAPIIKAPC